MQSEAQPVPCPVCATWNLQAPVLGYAQAPWRLKACRKCGMVYLENPPSYAQLEEDLAWERTFAAETAERRQRNPLLYKLGRLPKAAVQRLLKRDKLLSFAKRYFKPGPILDIGCAGGHTLANFPEQYIPYGIEISHHLSQMANSRFAPRGGTVIQADALTGLSHLPRHEFTGVIMTSFLEHEVHPRQTLLRTKTVMRTGGKLIVKVPNYASWNRRLRGARWCGFRFPDHVNYFTPLLLRRLLLESGFRMVRFRLVDRLPTSDTMWLVAELP